MSFKSNKSSSKNVLNSNLIFKLEKVLDTETKLYRQYLDVLEEQRNWLTKFNADKLQALNKKKQYLLESLEQAHKQRLLLMKSFPNNKGKRLSELIEIHCEKSDKKRLLNKINDLKKQVIVTKKEGFEFGQVVNFALNLVNGSISLLWHASRSVAKSYGRDGSIKQKYVPKTSRNEDIIKEA